MKKRIGILLVASLLLLTACGEKKTNVETKQEGKAASAKVASSEQAKKKAKVHYNGSYYSVKENTMKLSSQINIIHYLQITILVKILLLKQNCWS